MEDILLRRSGAAKLIMQKGYTYKYALQLVHKGALTQKLLPAKLQLEDKGLKENVYRKQEVVRFVETLPGIKNDQAQTV